MSSNRFRQVTGALFILGSVAVNIPYALLIANFDYPDILRQPAGEILVRFAAGGPGLVWTWLALAWLGLPLFVAIIMLGRLLEREELPYMGVGTAAGVIGAVVQMIGLLRWVFVVPVLARLYTDPAASAAAKEASVVAFQALHQFGGVLLGEHLGQAFTISWMLIISVAALRSNLFRPFVAWLGMVAAAIYLLAQTELFATVVPGFPVVAEAGLIGSLLWLAWMIVLGAFLLRNRPARS